MAAHTHDGVDWESRVAQLRRADEVDAPALREVAERLIERTPPGSTVVDVGCGAGGMSVALAEAMARRGGGTLVLVDATPALLAAAVANLAQLGDAVDTSGAAVQDCPAEPDTLAGQGGSADGPVGQGGTAGLSGDAAGQAGQGDGASGQAGLVGQDRPGDPGGGLAGSAGLGAAAGRGGVVGRSGVGGRGGVAGHGGVRGRVVVRAVRADVAGGALREVVPAARLVWASRVVHHLPDQQGGLGTLAELLTPGGCLAVAEGGLALRCLPWDLGVGEPGLADRLTARRDAWFAGMRSSMADSARMPYGWNRALAELGLVGVTAFSYLVDRPAPLSAQARASVVDWLTWMARTTDVLDSPDGDTVRRLLDPADPAFVGGRDDVFMLKATTVHLAWAR